MPMHTKPIGGVLTEPYYYKTSMGQHKQTTCNHPLKKV